MKLTKNFSKYEFDSKDGSEMPIEVIENIKILAENLQALRNELKQPIKINSGYRSPEHNAKIGGVKNSQHVKGKASDIFVNGMTPKEVAEQIELLIEKGEMMQGGIGVYDSFVHYDIRGKKARWNG